MQEFQIPTRNNKQKFFFYLMTYVLVLNKGKNSSFRYFGMGEEFPNEKEIVEMAS